MNASSHYTISPNPYDPASTVWQVKKANGSPVVIVNEEFGYSYPLTIDREELSAIHANKMNEARNPKPVVKSRQESSFSEIWIYKAPPPSDDELEAHSEWWAESETVETTPDAQPASAE